MFGRLHLRGVNEVVLVIYESVCKDAASACSVELSLTVCRVTEPASYMRLGLRNILIGCQAHVILKMGRNNFSSLATYVREHWDLGIYIDVSIFSFFLPLIENIFVCSN